MSSVCPRCAHTLPERLTTCPLCLLHADLAPPLLGSELELIEEIGAGGMGTVWRANHRGLGREVAVKVLRPALASDPDARRRFEREARALALLDHPGIVALLGTGEDAGQSYIVMELAPGRALSASLPLETERARRIAVALCDALVYAHGKGLVHRDVKPENVLVDEGGSVKLADFGIARALQGDADWTVTRTGLAVGTPQYMAPECLAGAPPDPRMDVFAIGVVLFQMLRGRRPLADLDALPAGFARIVRRATAADPALRHPDVAALRAELVALADEGRTLPAEERSFVLAVALVLTLATATALWALLACVTPRVLAAGANEPLVMLGRERLHDGRLVSRARFETGPVLAAVAAFAGALLAFGLLRHHWRGAGLDRPAPGGPLAGARGALICGLLSILVYGTWRALDATGDATLSAYVPILGGLIETAAVLYFWIAVLDATRRRAALLGSPALWLGAVLTLAPPVFELLAFVTSWRPTP